MELMPGLFKDKALLNSFFQAFTVSDDGRYLFVLDEKNGSIRWCRTAIDFFGLPGEQITHGEEDWLLRMHPEDRVEFRNRIEELRDRKTEKMLCKCRMKDKNGSYVSCEVSASLITNDNSEAVFIAGIVMNIGIQSRIDTVTGLPNLYAFFNDMKMHRKEDEETDVLLIGSTRFTEVNDVYGYSFGNEVLIKFADMLREYFGDKCEFYRMEGAKFAVRSEALPMKELSDIYDKLRIDSKQGFDVEGCRIHLFLAAGGMEVSDNIVSSHTLYSCLLYSYADSKDRHQGDLIVFHNRISEKNRQWLEELNVIRESVIDGCRGFYLCYQPIIRVSDGTLAGMEALIRWHNDKYGYVSPDEFISILEKDTVFPELGSFILRQACIDSKDFANRDPDFVVNVNLSYAQIEKSNFADSVINILDETRYSPKNLCLELTERCRIMDENMLRDKVATLRARGIRFALDDFGTGYSSLNLLRKMPIDEVKIDRQFIKDILDNRIDQNIINGLTHAVTESGKSICIEGVENEELQAFLQRYPVTYFQGYLYSKPVPIEEFKRLHFDKLQGLGPQVSQADQIALNEQMDNVIIRAAKHLHQGKSLDDAVAKVMAEMGTLIHPDRIYFGRVRDSQMVTVREWCSPGVKRNELQPVETIHNVKWWNRYANEDDVIIISDVAAVMLKAPEGVKDPGCRNFMEVLLKDGQTLNGYIGVENYVKAEFLSTKSLLQTIGLFLNAEIKNQLLIEQLTELSRKDQLTGALNRNAYEEDMMRIERKRVPLGIIFADLNGLKDMNDTFGHAKGDQLIIRAARLLQESFEDGVLYRIGGDEFIIVFEGMDQFRFRDYMDKESHIIERDSIFVSLGWGWTKNSASRERAQLDAEQMMYHKKAEYYRTHDRRRSS